MRVVVYGTGPSDPFVLKKFAEFAGIVGKQEVSIQAAGKGHVFGVDYILKELPQIAKTESRKFQKLVVVLDASELKKKKEHKSRREWMKRAVDAVPQGMTICIVYMNPYLEKVIRACLPREFHDEFDRKSNKVQKASRFTPRMTKELAESNTSYQDFVAALQCNCRRVLTTDNVRTGVVFPEAS